MKCALLFLFSLFFAFPLHAAYPPGSFHLSEDGKVLRKWLGKEPVVDMNTDEQLRDITEIADEAFSENNTLRSLILTDKLLKIGNYAFENASLEEIRLTPHLEEIGRGAFFGCKNLGSCILPERIKVLSQAVFSGCSSLKTIGLHNNIAEIEASAFYGCNALTVVEIPTLVKTIGNGAFAKCTGLKTIILHKGLTTIGVEAFFNCSELSDVDIPQSVKTIDESAFSGCTNLEAVLLGDQLQTLGQSAFAGCSKLTEVIIPDNLLKVGAWSFSGCTNLTRVTFGRQLEQIGIGAFSACTKLTSVKMEGQIKEIGKRAFKNCSALTSVVFGESPETIGDAAFFDCVNLENIVFREGLKTIGATAFSGCKKLQRIVLPNSVALLDDWAFFDCSLLREFSTGSGEINIGKEALANCSSLSTVVFGRGVKKVGKWCFNRCPELQKFVCKADTPPETDEGVFLETDLRKATLYVPAGKEPDYKSAGQWRDFGNIVADSFTHALCHGDILQLSAGRPGESLWSCADSDVATVSVSGLLRARLIGRTTVTAISGEHVQDFEVIVQPRYTDLAEPYTDPLLRTFTAVKAYETAAKRREIAREEIGWLPGHEMVTFAVDAAAPVTVQYLVNKKTQELLPYTTMVFASRKVYREMQMPSFVEERYHPAKGTDSEGETFDGWARGKVGLEYRELSVDEGEDPVINLAYFIVEKAEIKPLSPDIVCTLAAEAEVSLNIASKSGAVQINWGDGVWHDFPADPATGTVIKGRTKVGVVEFRGRDITRLFCGNNDITSLDLHHVPALEVLHCYSNALTTLTLDSAQRLQTLNCSDNRLTALDTHSLLALSDLNAANNALEMIDLSYNKALVSLSLLGNSLEKIDLSALPLLEDLSLGYNRLTSLHVSTNPNISWIICYKNRLSTEALRNLYASLPQREERDGTLKVLDSRDDEVAEGNMIDVKDFDIARNKGWKVMDGTKEIPTPNSRVLAAEGSSVRIEIGTDDIAISSEVKFWIYRMDGVLVYAGSAGDHFIARRDLAPFAVLRTAAGEVRKLTL